MRTASLVPLLLPLLAPLFLAAVPGTAAAQASAFQLRPLERVRNPLVGRADVSGVVFEDLDGDGLLDAGEPGLADVVVALDDGRYALTDVDGRYQLNEIGPGQRAIVLRRPSLPVAAEPSRPGVIREVPPGAWVRVDFPVTVRRETLRIGRPEALGYRIFPSFEELPVNVVGNATDIQALANGVRIDFPVVDVVVRGLARGGYVTPDRFRRLKVRLRERAARNPTAWTLQLAGSDGAVLWTRAGDGKPPRRLSVPGTDEAGQPLAAPASYALRLCVDYGPDVRACSPYRPFGVTGGSGRGAVQPKIEAPTTETRAQVNGKSAPLDPDGSFILPVEPDAERRIAIELTRDDGRFARAAIEVPRIELSHPVEPFPVEWGRTTDAYEAPPEPGPVSVAVAGSTTPPTARLQVGKTDVPIEGGRFATEVTADLGKSRSELVVASPEGWNTLYELTLLLSERTPEGEPIVTVPGIPELSVQLPPEGAPLTRDRLALRGEAQPGTTVTANGATLTTTGGTFEAEVPLDPEVGRLEITVTDEAGRTGSIVRTWPAPPSRVGTTLWGDAEPFIRVIHEGDDDFRRGFAGTVRATAQRWRGGGVSAFANASVSSADRLATDDEAPWAVPELYAGAEGWLGEHLVLGLRYAGGLYLNPNADALPSRHQAFLSAAWLGRRFDVYADAGGDTGPGLDSELNPVAGGGLGLRYRPHRALSVRARAFGAVPVGGEGEGHVLDVTGQAAWHPGPAGWPVITVRVAHLEDTRTVDPEAAGSIGHVGIVVPLHERVQLIEAAGAWIGESGAFGGDAVTGLNVTRLAFQPTDRMLLALDYRLQTGPPNEHAFTVEGDWRTFEWLRIGLVYRLVKVSGGGELSSRFQGRLQALF